ncbi:MAG: pyrimidine-nucleoside phosphorylase [Clostridioides sp.]|nr:pyrimidine-nucleoside phosphorylase [Clostridioides sp.]
MRMYDIIKKKRDGFELSKEEIEFFIKGYVDGSIPDYQVSALLMAIYFNKMNKEETLFLTNAMKNSGETIDLSDIKGIKVDKHSTGGVGDKTTIALLPLVCSCGLISAKMSGRGLGHTGGTIDKLESIAGFNTNVEIDEFINSVNKIGVCLSGQSKEVAIADKKIYALRDVTATVDNISLIASSIMSKKLASGTDKIVLDVKTGDGAFMKNIEDAVELAKEMVDIGNGSCVETVAIVSDMNEPLGFAVGNSLEVMEAIDTLKGKGPKDLEELCKVLGAHMLLLGGVEKDYDEGYKKIEQAIKSGSAISKLKEFIKNQGGNENVVDDYSLFPKSKYIFELKSKKSGFVSKIKAEEIGVSAMMLGAGRGQKEDVIDLSVGIVLNKKIGDFIDEGQLLARIHYNDEEKFKSAVDKIEKAFEFSETQVESKKLIYTVIK